MPALHALFCLRLWVFGLIFSRGKVLYMCVLCFFVQPVSEIWENCTFASGMAEQSGVWKEKKAEHCGFWRCEIESKG